MSGAMARGAQRVGLLEDLSSVERLAVRWLRHWERDPEGQAALESSLSMVLGVDRARSVRGVFADLMQKLDVKIIARRIPSRQLELNISSSVLRDGESCTVRRSTESNPVFAN